MRSLFLPLLLLTGSAWSQAFTDAAAAAAGATIGGMAGKKVGEGVANVLQKVGTTAVKASETNKIDTKDKGTIFKVGKAVVKDHSLVPPPPPLRRASVVPPPPPALVAEPVLSLPPPPPPPVMTAENLGNVSAGMNRADVLKMGVPASRISMFDSGHLVEIYRYMTRDSTIGVVRLSDGAVASVQVSQ